MRKFLLLPVFALVALVAWYAALLWVNNRAVQSPDRAVLAERLEHAIDWLTANVKAGESPAHPHLWWMIKQAADVSGNTRLVGFYRSNEPQLLHNRSLQVWLKMFDPGAIVGPGRADVYRNLPDYEYLFLYGQTCAEELEREPAVRGQLHPEFCASHFLEPRCVSQQLLGVRFLLQQGCGDAGELTRLVLRLQDRIVTELTWDPRVVDAYLLRVLALAESGAIGRVRPAWIRRILDAQHADGGWGDVDPVLYLPHGVVMGFASTELAHRRLLSDFHATAKGIWLLSLLLDR